MSTRLKAGKERILELNKRKKLPTWRLRDEPYGFGDGSSVGEGSRRERARFGAQA
ncbi:hypothetical protein HPP92_006213 [Vanilla planifolia]|uniref:Uncharacterized protein n=1 Tax=Vanilla planifolia TaxID=51239 RepID=A0A835RIA4_VANPL|nr:hypothetical protein HPP92_006213 [Vanilla planifolia]